MVSTKEMLDALRTIRKVCFEYKGDCDNCPLRNSSGLDCELTLVPPQDWVLNDENWKAFSN